jgi:glycosyltransferase involved in cell wall biosynthesis
MSSILLITNIFPPTIGGPAIFIDRLAHNLSADGHDVSVVCSGDVVPPKDYDQNRKFKIYRVSLSNRYVYEIKIRLVLFWQILLHKKILVNGLESYVAPIAQILGRKYILKIVGDGVWEQGRNWGIVTSNLEPFQAEKVPNRLKGIEYSRNKCLELSKKIVVPGAWFKKILCGWGMPEDKILVIRNGVPLEIFDGHQPAVRNGELDIVFVGRLTNWKGVETVLLAMKQVTKTRLTIIGEGPELPMLTGLCHQLELEKSVEFVGKMDQSELHKRLKVAHALLLPSSYEGLSHTLLEAAAAGLARIASDIPGNSEVIENEVDGLLVPYADVDGWRKAIQRLADDDQFRIDLGLKAQESARKDSFSDSVSKYVELIAMEG